MKYRKDFDAQRARKLTKWINDFARVVEREDGCRLDAGETAQFTRALAHVIKQGFEKQYPDLKARTFLPMSNDIPAGAKTIHPWIVQGFGKARLGTPVSNQIPRVEVQRSENPNPVVPATVKWVITKEQIKEASFGKFDLNSVGMKTAMETVEKGIDDMLSFGFAPRGLVGFVNNADLNDVALTTGTWSSPATSDQIIADCELMLQTIVTNSLDKHNADTFLLPPTRFKYLSIRVTNTDVTILDFLLKNTSLNTIDKWQALETANAGGPRILMYKRDMKIVHGYADTLVESNGTQLHDLEYSTIMQQRSAGVQIVEKTGLIKADNS